MKIVFMGTPDFAVPVLEKLIADHEVVAVYTRAPAEGGRGKKLRKTPVHELAEKNGIEVHTPKSLKTEGEQAVLRSFGAEVAIVAAYGLILPQAVLDMFPYGCINVHASLLPRWRGAAPIQRAIEAGDKQSGISIMQMVAALDAGDVLGCKAVDITPKMTGGELHDVLAKTGAPLLTETLSKLESLTPVKQDEALVTYASKLEKSECLLDFHMNAERLADKIRAFSPFPGTYFIYKGERFKVHSAEVVDGKGTAGEILEGEKELVIATGKGALKILKIQREGRQALSITELLRGFGFEKNVLL